MHRILISALLVVAFLCCPAFGGYYNGSTQDATTFKRYNGASWVDCTKKYYNGSAWVEVEVATTSCETLIYEPAGLGSNTVPVAKDSSYAFTGGQWLGADKDLCAVEAYMIKTGDVSTINFVAKVYNMSGDNLTGSALATSSAVIGADMTNSAYTPKFVFDPPVSITSGQAIVIVRSDGNVDATNYLTTKRDSSDITSDFQIGVWNTSLVKTLLYGHAVIWKLYE